VRFGQDAYSDAVRPGLTIRPAQNRSQRADGEEGAMEWVACVGIDWADQRHAFAVRGADGREEKGEFDSAPEAVHAWVRHLRDTYGEGSIVVGIEQSRGALLYALSTYDFLQLVPVNPRAISSYRRSLRLSGAKDDPLDAMLIREFVASHLEQLRVWRADDATTRRLRLLVEHRRSVVDQRTALTLELTAILKQYFPQILEWFGEAASTLAREFIQRWPTLRAVQRARADVLKRVVRRHTRRTADHVDELISRMRSSVELTGDAVIIDALSLRAQMLVSLIDTTDQSVRRYDTTIADCWRTHADRTLFESFPGAGAVMAPRLAAAFGSDRGRFADAAEVQTYSGIAPVIERSGKQCWVHARWQCPKFLRQTFHEFAEASIPHCRWAREFYRAQKSRGAGHHAAIRALAFRWIRILFRCWQTGRLYDDKQYLAALKARSSPLAVAVA
jgi:transposase